MSGVDEKHRETQANLLKNQKKFIKRTEIFSFEPFGPCFHISKSIKVDIFSGIFLLAIPYDLFYTPGSENQNLT
jgi:hypothetical protein